MLISDQDLVLYISNETKERPTRPSPRLLSRIRLESILRLRPGERIRTAVEKKASIDYLGVTQKKLIPVRQLPIYVRRLPISLAGRRSHLAKSFSSFVIST